MPNPVWVIIYKSGGHSGGFSERKYLEYTISFIEKTGFYKDNIQSILKVTFK